MKEIKMTFLAQKKEDASAASNDDDYLKSFMHILRMREKLMSMNSKGKWLLLLIFITIFL